MKNQRKTGAGAGKLVFQPSWTGTIGDVKPLMLLAVYVAKGFGASQRVVVDLSPWQAFNKGLGHGFIDFAYSILEPNGTISEKEKKTASDIVIGNRLIVVRGTEYGAYSKSVWGLGNEKRDIFIKSSIWATLAPNQINLDFGDNGGCNRFALPVLQHRKDSVCKDKQELKDGGGCFGCVTYPEMGREANRGRGWSSDKKNLFNLRKFVDKWKKPKPESRKTLLLFLSLSNSSIFPEQALAEFLQDSKFEDWAVILVGFGLAKKVEKKNSNKVSQLLTPRVLYSERLFYSKYVEYEDVVTEADFIISTCGAGSVSVPVLAGIPQTCVLKGIGNDKPSNLKDLLFYNLGPDGNKKYDDSRRSNDSTTSMLVDIMKEVVDNLDSYTREAEELSKTLQKIERSKTSNWENCFKNILEHPMVASRVFESGKLPAKYRLNIPESLSIRPDSPH